MSLLSITKKILNREKTAVKPQTAAVAAKKVAATGDALLAARIGLQLLLTEKSISQQSRNVVAFRTIPHTSKGQIAEAVAAKYGVKVKAVRTSQFKGKRRQRGATIGRTNNWKKAYVTVDDISKLSVAP